MNKIINTLNLSLLLFHCILPVVYAGINNENKYGVSAVYT